MAAIIRRVTKPTDEELDQGATALSEAFGDSFFLSGLGEDRSLVTPLLKAYLAAALVGGQIYFGEVPDHGVVGAAVWFGPGQKFLSSDEQRNAGWNQIMQKLDTKYIRWWDYFLETYDKFCERTLGPGTKLRAYHLQVIGVVPQHQKNGITRGLIKTVEELATSKQLALCLETTIETNVKIYKAMGFVVEGSEAMKSTGDKDFEMFCLFKQT